LTTGASTQEIAHELVVSLDTVQSHVKHILRKLHVHSRAEAVTRAHELRRRRPDWTAE
jgi:DNA-binding NarL/FixJ family response regulator